MENLLQDGNAIFPGENWFYYWKIAASLWHQKIVEIPSRTIIIPINWAVHTDTGDEYYFASNRPETNLQKLVQIAEAAGKKLIFFVPVTPAPFLANGGVPHLLARSLSYTTKDRISCVLDNDGKLNKMYSFFDTKLFSYFQKYIYALAEYFYTNRINADLYAIHCGYVTNGVFHSFLQDSSRSFETSFSRFVNLKMEESKELVMTTELEKTFKNDFFDVIAGLYSDCVREAFESVYETELKIAFLGAAENDLLPRIYESDTSKRYQLQLRQAACSMYLTSSVLLPPIQKNRVLGQEIKYINQGLYNEIVFNRSGIDNEARRDYTALVFFRIVENVIADNIHKSVALWDHVNDKYDWCYQKISTSTFEQFSEEFLAITPQPITIISGSTFSRKAFNQIIRLLMNGHKIILDIAKLEAGIMQRLEGFIIENSLKVEKINFLCDVQHVSLGEGRLLLYDSTQLASHSAEEKYQWWNRIITTLKVIHVDYKNQDGISVFWQTRPATSIELQYDEVRKIDMFNHSSYKKKIKMPLPSQMVVKKILRMENATVISGGNFLDIELMPNGIIEVDFGIFQEGM